MQGNIDFIDFVHPELNEEVTAIGGYYVLTKEALVSFLSHSLLYFVGYAVIDTSCCGVGGCSYAFVPGFMLKWKYKKTTDNHLVSRIQPIKDPSIQREIRRLIEHKETVHQISFD
ncbi:MAG: hypothetical protein H8E17_03775 [Deltaproteobacteria bacterium]|nr:hypothetical protein [Deltaproteobacteria bacterium]